MLSVTTMRVLGQRPTQLPEPNSEVIPADFIIYNGVYPLMGTVVDGVGLTWQAEPILGSYYAAIMPGDPQGPRWRQINAEVGAVQVEYVSLDQVRRALRAYYSEVRAMTPDEIEPQLTGDEATLWRRYVDCGLHVEMVEVKPI